jgi:hypothetical protein
MQRPYEIDIQRTIPNSYFEPQISYRFTKKTNKRYKITDDPRQAISFCETQCRQKSLKRKLDAISEEVTEPVVCGKRKLGEI